MDDPPGQSSFGKMIPRTCRRTKLFELMNYPSILLCVLLLAFRSQSAEKPALPITFEHFSLVGQLSNGHAGFTLTGTARIESARGGTLPLLRGPVALTGFT